jgi:hypothetical protein
LTGLDVFAPPNLSWFQNSSLALKKTKASSAVSEMSCFTFEKKILNFSFYFQEKKMCCAPFGSLYSYFLFNVLSNFAYTTAGFEPSTLI